MGTTRRSSTFPKPDLSPERPDLGAADLCRVFEFTVSFPLDTELVIKVMDHDFVGTDDVIGETRIDLENRFYTCHRACCGLALYYDV